MRITLVVGLPVPQSTEIGAAISHQSESNAMQIKQRIRFIAMMYQSCIQRIYIKNLGNAYEKKIT